MLFRYYLLAAILIVVLWWPVSYVFSCYFYKKRVLRITKNMTSVDDYPVLGCALRFLGKNNEEMMDILKDEFSKQTTPWLAWLGTKCFVVVDNPEDLQVIMTCKECMEKGDVYRFFNRGVGLFSAPAHIWSKQRKQLSMSFNNPMCWSFLGIFNRKSSILVEKVGQRVGKGDFNLMNLAMACTQDITCETILGTPSNIQDGENMNYMQALNDWLAAVTRRSINIFMHPESIYKLTQTYRMESNAISISDSIQEVMIQKKMKELESSNNNNLNFENETSDTKYESPQIFLERLIKLRNRGKISDQAIRDQVALVSFGGQDTTSYTTSLTLLLLAMHPKIEQKVMDELNSVLGDTPIDADLTMEQINDLVYMEQVIKETLRVYTVAPVLIRHCTDDLKLPNYTIPKDTEVLISIFTLHRRKDIWGEDADKFNPDHFDKEACAKRNPFSFMSFSNGPRNCIGRRFSFIIMKTMLAKLLRRYRFSTDLGIDDVKFRLEVTAKPVGGVVLQVEDRN